MNPSLTALYEVILRSERFVDDQALAHKLGLSTSAIRKLRGQLVSRGLVKCAGKARRGQHLRLVSVWCATGKPVS